MSESAGSTSTGGPTEVPVCPRHPDRESYVRCQRCHRPVCPQCQRQAAVGVQCVDCAAAGARAVRPTRTVFGGRARQAAGRWSPTSLIGLCVLVNLLQYVPGLDVTGRFAFAPALAGDEPWRFLTAAFLHATGGTYGVAHILFNMYALFLVGPVPRARLRPVAVRGAVPAERPRRVGGVRAAHAGRQRDRPDQLHRRRVRRRVRPVRRAAGGAAAAADAAELDRRRARRQPAARVLPARHRLAGAPRRPAGGRGRGRPARLRPQARGGRSCSGRAGRARARRGRAGPDRAHGS